jgi:hypothetical protein
MMYLYMRISTKSYQVHQIPTTIPNQFDQEGVILHGRLWIENFKAHSAPWLP